MTSSGTMQSAIRVVAHYCKDCIHLNVCAYADDVQRYEAKYGRNGTGTGCVPTVVINCTERRIEVQEQD